jgi:hypothetical protein
VRNYVYFVEAKGDCSAPRVVVLDCRVRATTARLLARSPAVERNSVRLQPQGKYVERITNHLKHLGVAPPIVGQVRTR